MAAREQQVDGRTFVRAQPLFVQQDQMGYGQSIFRVGRNEDIDSHLASARNEQGRQIDKVAVEAFVGNVIEQMKDGRAENSGSLVRVRCVGVRAQLDDLVQLLKRAWHFERIVAIWLENAFDQHSAQHVERQVSIIVHFQGH